MSQAENNVGWVSDSVTQQTQAQVKSIYVDGSYAHELRIPETWEFARLDEVIKLEGGSQPPKSEFRYEAGEGLIRLIQIRDYKSDEYKVYIPKASARRFVGADDVMIGRYGPPIFQILRGLEGAYNVALMKAVPVCDVFSNNYLFRYLSNEDLYNYVNSSSDRTAGQSGVNKEHLEKYPVAIPPLAEQQQIAAKLDELLAQVDTLKTRLDTLPKILKRFRQSVLAAAVSGKLTEDWRNGSPQTLTIKKFQEVIADSLVGLVRSSEEQFGNVDGGFLYLKMNNIDTNWGTELRNLVTVRCTESEFERYSLRSGDWLFNTRNSIELVGKSCVWRDTPGFIYNNNILRIRFLSGVLPDFIEIWFRSPKGRSSLNLIKSATTNVAAIYQKSLMQLSLNLPPIEEQTEIVSRVEQLFTYADQIEQRVKDAQARVNHLTQAILAKAFRGELTADWREQNPDLISGENSAAALLAKIKAEREKIKPKKLK